VHPLTPLFGVGRHGPPRSAAAPAIDATVRRTPSAIGVIA
jgi:hypothetical protein